MSVSANHKAVSLNLHRYGAGGLSGRTDGGLSAARVRAAMRQKLEITNHIICKVAVQAAAPAVGRHELSHSLQAPGVK
jgi:hypothetical protein